MRISDWSSDVCSSDLTESLNVMRSVVLSGQCHAIIPLHSVLADVASGRLRSRRIVNPDVKGLVSLAHKAAKPLSRVQRAVYDVIIRTGRLMSDRWQITPGTTSTSPPLTRSAPSTKSEETRVGK